MQTYFGKATQLKGLLKTTRPIRLDGEFDGEIDSQSEVTVGETGRFKGKIKAKVFSNYGHATGDVLATEKVTLFAKSKMKGDIRATSLVVEEGADFEGNSVMASQLKLKEINE